jgi:lysophospholipase L1-like esterase
MTGRKFVRGLLLFCAAAASAVILAACGSHTTAPSPIVEQPAPQPSPQPPPPAPVPVLAVTRILAFGDSMTAGTTSPAVVPPALTAGPPQSYPAKLQDLVNGRYTGQTIIVLNAGKPSEHVYDAATLARFNHEVSDANPNLIVLMEGANDLNDAGEAVNDTIASTVGTLEEMVKEAGRRRIPIMVATLPPQRLPKGHGAPYIGRFNDAVKTMAAKKGGILVDVNARLPNALIGQDGLHPTEEGYQRIAEIFLDAMKSAYETIPPGVAR